MSEEDLEKVKAFFFLFWKTRFSNGITKSCNQMAQDLLVPATSYMFIASQLVGRFYDGSFYSEAVWERAKAYFLQEEELMR
jgi:hypothetical protein